MDRASAGRGPGAAQGPGRLSAAAPPDVAVAPGDASGHAFAGASVSGTVPEAGPGRTPRLDAAAKIAGEAVYAGDVRLPGMLEAALIRSPFPHARIRGIDAAEALRVPGVLRVCTAADLLPGLQGRRVRDMPLLARDEARFAGDRVAVVLALTPTAAERGAAAVRVEYEPLPAVLDPREAILPDAVRVHAAPWEFPGARARREDGHNLQVRVERRWGSPAEEALAAAPFRIDRTYRTPSVHQGYLEPHACVAAAGPDGTLRLWSAHKAPYLLRDYVAACLDIPAEGVEVCPVHIGGDFGGKGGPMDEPLCAALSRLTGRPVRLALRYAEELGATNPRLASHIRLQLGCDAEGRLLALVADALFNGGAYAAFMPEGAAVLGSPYRIAAGRVLTRIAYTHTVPGGHMRNTLGPQGVFAFESALDELAAAASLDPLTVRRRNLLRNGEANGYGSRWAQARGHEVLDAVEAEYRDLPVPAGWRVGRGVAVCERATRAGGTALRLRRDADGGFTATVPFPETGTGAHTMARDAVAGALGVPPERVRVVQGSTSALPRDEGAGHSRVTTTVSRALGPLIEAFRAAGGHGEVTVETQPADSSVTSFCAQIAQVAVDPETGQVRVLQLVAAVDVAQVVNPGAHRLQIEGAMAMGYGFACLEDLDVAEGRVRAGHLGDFKLPSARDLPSLRVRLVRGGRGEGLADVKPIGELTNVPTAAAVANAVAAATGVRVRRLPVTAERVYRALQGGWGGPAGTGAGEPVAGAGPGGGPGGGGGGAGC